MKTPPLELDKYAGKRGGLSVKGFDVPIPVKIINAKFAYGRLLLEVVPAGGDPRWVEGRRVTIEGHEQGS